MPAKDADAHGLVRLSVYIAVVMSLIMAVLLFFTSEKLLRYFDFKLITSYIMLIPLAMFFSSIVQMETQWLIRKKKFNIIARSSIIQSFIHNLSKVLAGLFIPVGGALVVLVTLSYFFHGIILGFGIKRSSQGTENILKKSTDISLASLAIRYCDFPLYRAPQVLINAASQGLPVLMFAGFFGPATAGFYSIGRAVLDLPSQIIGKSVADVFYPDINEAAKNGKNLVSMLIKSTFVLIVFGMVPFGLIIAYGPSLFSFVFGSEWSMAGEYARWLSFMMFFGFINKPCVAALPIIGLQKGLLYYEIISTGMKVIAIYIGGYVLKDSLMTVAFFSFVGAVAYVYLILWVIFSSSKYVYREN
jgi:O-antigen/teichoic acid export membrane protein